MSVTLAASHHTSVQFLQSYHKMSLIKVAWHVLRVKNMHPGSPSDPSRTAAAQAKPRSISGPAELGGHWPPQILQDQLKWWFDEIFYSLSSSLTGLLKL